MATGLIQEEILKAAQTSDLIVMRTHGRTGLRLIMLGSVTEKVIGAAPCAVLAVKHPPLERQVPWTGEAQGGAEGLMVEVVLRTGDAATEILDYADERGFDLIAMATHGRSGLRCWLLGSVANKVLRTTDIPVLSSRAWSPSGESGKATEVQSGRVESTSG
jgi:nucleotide-binding universal stress UspA family protein